MELKEKLERAIELKYLIDSTEKALKDIRTFDKKKSTDKRFYKEGPYNLNIAEHGDGSGKSVKLNRYYGNGKILTVIEKELEEQVEYLKKEAENLLYLCG